MKEFIRHSISIEESIYELQCFEALLASKPELKEREDILPFFKKNLNLTALLGTYIHDIANPDRLASEYDLFGDFVCDLVVGDSMQYPRNTLR